jgi:pyrroline-5-carboxylate reductase
VGTIPRQVTGKLITKGIGFIGAGRGSRILFGPLRDFAKHHELPICFWTRRETTATSVQSEFPEFCAIEDFAAFEACDPIYLGIPSGAAPGVLKRLRRRCSLSGKLILSFCVQLSQEVLTQLLPDAYVIRFVHSLPCQVGKGLIVAYRPRGIPDDIWQSACEHLKINGNLLVVDDERLLLESIPLLCLPAVLLRALGELEDAVADSCPDLQNARVMFRQTIVGVGAWLEMLTEDYETGVNLVATPGGLTEKAVRHIEGNIKGLIDAFHLELEAVRGLTRPRK